MEQRNPSSLDEVAVPDSAGDPMPDGPYDMAEAPRHGSAVRPVSGKGRSLVASLAREIRICHGFIKYDYATGFIPPALFVVAVAHHHQLAPLAFLVTAIKGAALFFLYTYSFCLSNQLAGIAEDRLNKPDRLIPTRQVSAEQAWTRLVFVLVGYAALGLWLGVAWPVLLWQAALLLHNQGRWSWTWFGKNLIMGVGTLAQLAAAWALVAPITTVGWRWILTMSIIIFTLIPLQDLRDIHGDHAGGRRTFPLVFGVGFTRAYVAVGFAVLPLAVHTQLMRPAWPDARVIAADLVLCVWAWCIALRTVFLRTPRADHWTYTLWTLWYTATLASALVAL